MTKELVAGYRRGGIVERFNGTCFVVWRLRHLVFSTWYEVAMNGRSTQIVARSRHTGKYPARPFPIGRQSPSNNGRYQDGQGFARGQKLMLAELEASVSLYVLIPKISVVRFSRTSCGARIHESLAFLAV